jgi:hypothetical protein
MRGVSPVVLTLANSTQLSFGLAMSIGYEHRLITTQRKACGLYKMVGAQAVVFSIETTSEPIASRCASQNLSVDLSLVHSGLHVFFTSPKVEYKS